MVFLRVAGWVAIGGLLAGCQSGKQGPQAASAEPMGQQSAAQIEQSWRAANPGSQVGVVNAVLPARRMISVADLPYSDVKKGDVVTVLLDPRGNSTIEAVVVNKNSGYLQLAYRELQPGQRDPRLGDLAVWYPGGQAVPPRAVQPELAEPANRPTNEAAAPAPTTQPAARMENTQAPADNAVPAAHTARPTTQPARTGSDAGGQGAPPTTQPSTNAPTPAENPAPPAKQPELNK